MHRELLPRSHSDDRNHGEPGLHAPPPMRKMLHEVELHAQLGLAFDRHDLIDNLGTPTWVLR